MTEQMDHSSSNMVLARLQDLERSNRLLRALQVGFAGALVAAITVAAFRLPEDTVTAREFVLVDAAGEVCAVLGVQQAQGSGLGSSFLVMRSEHGEAIRLDSGRGNPTLYLSGLSENGGGASESYALLRVDKKGGPELDLCDYFYTGTLPREYETLRTRIGVPYPDGEACVRVVRGVQNIWSAPDQQDATDNRGGDDQTR
jgi:hypothetical protein